MHHTIQKAHMIIVTSSILVNTFLVEPIAHGLPSAVPFALDITLYVLYMIVLNIT